MKIAYVVITHKPISETSTGGIETFSFYILRALSTQNCQLTLYAASETDMSTFPGVSLRGVYSIAELEKSPDENLESKSFTLNYSLYQYAGVKQAMDDGTYDVIHVSQAQWYAPFLFGLKNTAVVTTVHVNDLRPKTLAYILKHFPGPAVVNISNSSASAFGSYLPRRTIYNGIDESGFPFVSTPKDYVAWLGRIAPVKGLKEAVLAAKQANVPFIASGPIDFPEYFKHEVKPLLDVDRRVIGPLSPTGKAAFLGNARAVLSPVQWDEPFGLVAVEAMACGTPVIAYARGGLVETVVDGITGFMIEQEDLENNFPTPPLSLKGRRGELKSPLIIKKRGVAGLVDAVKRIGEIDRAACRRHVEAKFSAQVMAEKYLEYYKQTIAAQV